MLNSNIRPRYVPTSMFNPDIYNDFIPIMSPLRILPSWLSEFDKLFFSIKKKRNFLEKS